MKPTTTHYRLAAWLRLFHEKRDKMNRAFDRAEQLEDRGYYERSDSCRKEAEEYRAEAHGMIDALYCLGYSETEALEAENIIRAYIEGRA